MTNVISSEPLSGMTLDPLVVGLKSRLRHLLADVCDAEESGDDSDALADLRRQLSDTRRQLHAAFATEDSIIVRLQIASVLDLLA